MRKLGRRGKARVEIDCKCTAFRFGTYSYGNRKTVRGHKNTFGEKERTREKHKGISDIVFLKIKLLNKKSIARLFFSKYADTLRSIYCYERQKSNSRTPKYTTVSFLFTVPYYTIPKDFREL